VARQDSTRLRGPSRLRGQASPKPTRSALTAVRGKAKAPPTAPARSPTSTHRAPRGIERIRTTRRSWRVTSFKAAATTRIADARKAPSRPVTAPTSTPGRMWRVRRAAVNPAAPAHSPADAAASPTNQATVSPSSSGGNVGVVRAQMTKTTPSAAPYGEIRHRPNPPSVTSQRSRMSFARSFCVPRRRDEAIQPREGQTRTTV
jgi:hypothetical protein